ncbi:ABC transporter ATP-binding protein [Dictyobacter arantiisoli]|uniref:Multidrug ABC transporter ATP-binding protein n=1 Tax=Dictyobacter arantiisoli TaxID=2014874 RepID=A0A5A5T699_9CHLR|nr:ABC transporter ATP-binding protein [Dictyobacter arantiisoli]GCF06980.1 multidrug ABC transporter ATP-binding protein [Dictyobacter arantiisoli]
MEIEIAHLTKVYRGGVCALSALSLTIPTGMFGLLGPNGAGKTTLMRILAGILRPSSGDLHVGECDGTTWQGQKTIKQFLGYVPQDLGMYPDLKIDEFLNYIGILKGLSDRTMRQQRVEYLLEMVALSQFAKRSIRALSGGMKRRVGIAQALLNDPKLLIVDEPTAGLDPEERIRFRNLLSDLGNERTVLLSTHIVEDIAQTCPRLAVMKSGQIIFQGTTTDLVNIAKTRVWSVTSATRKPEGNVIIVSTINRGGMIDYRIIGTPASEAGATLVEPTLEDGYVWLMNSSQGDREAQPSHSKSV